MSKRRVFAIKIKYSDGTFSDEIPIGLLEEDLAHVAISGEYEDLQNAPKIKPGEGEDSIVSNEGYSAEGDFAHAEGYGTIATDDYQHVMGRYNKINEETDDPLVFVIGNGTSGSNMFRSNAATVDWDGNGWFSGRVSAGTQQFPAPIQKSNDLTTKQYVDDKISDIEIEGGGGINVQLAGENLIFLNPQRNND